MASNFEMPEIDMAEVDALLEADRRLSADGEDNVSGNDNLFGDDNGAGPESDADQDNDACPEPEVPAVELKTSPSTVWGRIQMRQDLVYEDIVSVLELIPESVIVCHQRKGGEYKGEPKHGDTFKRLLELPDVYGAVRVWRRLPGEHAIWCLFRKDGKSRALRPGNPEALFAGEGSVFDKATRGKGHALGTLGNHCFLNCQTLGGKRPNFVDYVEGLL